MTNKYYQIQKKDSEKKLATDIEIFLKKKKTKGEKWLEKDIEI